MNLHRQSLTPRPAGGPYFCAAPPERDRSRGSGASVPERAARPHVCHVSLSHQWDDSRTFNRMCCDLARHGFPVTMVAQAPRETVEGGVRIVPPGLDGKIARIFFAGLLLPRLLRLRADIYHCHDPALVPWMVVLQRLLPRSAVIYDVREFYPETLVDSRFLGWDPLTRLLSRLVHFFEPRLAARLAGTIAVTEPIARRFREAGARVTVIRNVVRLGDLAAPEAGTAPAAAAGVRRPYTVIGGTIHHTRCMEELVAAIGLLRRRGIRLDLHCIGIPKPEGYADQLRAVAREYGVEEQLSFLETLPWGEYQQVVSQAAVGLVLYAPRLNNEMGVPNRLYEFMAHALPIVASDFPLVGAIVRDARCGRLLERTEPEAIADVLEYLLTHPEEAKRLGESGRDAVRDRYCWEGELDSLLRFYRETLDRRTSLP